MHPDFHDSRVFHIHSALAKSHLESCHHLERNHIWNSKVHYLVMSLNVLSFYFSCAFTSTVPTFNTRETSSSLTPIMFLCLWELAKASVPT